MMSIFKEISELILGFGLFINACLFIPQGWRLYKTKNATSVSLITFSGFVFIGITAVINGVLSANWAMAIGYILTVLATGAVVVITLYYRYFYPRRCLRGSE